MQQKVPVQQFGTAAISQVLISLLRPPSRSQQGLQAPSPFGPWPQGFHFVGGRGKPDRLQLSVSESCHM